jgi:ComF family protein
MAFERQRADALHCNQQIHGTGRKRSMWRDARRMLRNAAAACVLPQHCVFCGAYDPRQAVCGQCMASLPGRDAERCPVCADLSPHARICGRCLSHPPRFSHVAAALSYRFPIDGLVQRVKYAGDLTMIDALAALLAPRAACEARPDILVPMPLAPLRLRERGFNQALEIARVLSRQLQLTLLPDCLRRTRDTAPQAMLPWNERRRNIRGAFACDGGVQGLHVAVVDDVVTTGETLNEAARTLLRAGASKVVGWVVARTERP